MVSRPLLVAALLGGWLSPAGAEVVTLRMATAAPDGSAWARELVAFSREVKAATKDQVQVKWYLGGIAGGELEVRDRIQRGQLDGTGSGGMLCQELSPSMRIMRMRGLFLNSDEATYVRGRLKPVFDEEFRAAGFVHLASANLGSEVLLSRRPVRTLDELRKLRFWRWDLDRIAAEIDRAMGVGSQLLPLGDAGRAYEEGRIDGFLAVPAATVAFQWFSRARYVMDLPMMGHLWACLIVTERAFDRVSYDDQQVVRAAAAKLSARLNEVSRAQDAALLGGLFAKQGLQPIHPSEAFRAELLNASRRIRERMGEQLLPKGLLAQVLTLLADYRSERLR